MCFSRLWNMIMFECSLIQTFNPLSTSPFKWLENITEIEYKTVIDKKKNAHLTTSVSIYWNNSVLSSFSQKYFLHQNLKILKTNKNKYDLYRAEMWRWYTDYPSIFCHSSETFHECWYIGNPLLIWLSLCVKPYITPGWGSKAKDDWFSTVT